MSILISIIALIQVKMSQMETVGSLIFHCLVTSHDVSSLVWLRWIGGFSWKSAFYFTIWSLMLQIFTSIVFVIRYVANYLCVCSLVEQCCLSVHNCCCVGLSQPASCVGSSGTAVDVILLDCTYSFCELFLANSLKIFIAYKLKSLSNH